MIYSAAWKLILGTPGFGFGCGAGQQEESLSNRPTN
jgi:hypothetical protein